MPFKPSKFDPVFQCQFNLIPVATSGHGTAVLASIFAARGKDYDVGAIGSRRCKITVIMVNANESNNIE
jgi:hypothetical protein